MKKILLLLLVFILSNTLTANEKEIFAWSYFNHPPFSDHRNRGLNRDLVNHLNEYYKGKYRFKLKILSRKSLTKRLENRDEGIVLFVNWMLMRDKKKTKYLWSNTLFEERDEVLSLKDEMIEYRGKESLKGLSFGAIKGRKYKEIDSLIYKDEIEPFYIYGEKQAFRALLAKRVQFITQPKSIANYLIKDMRIEKKIYFSLRPLSSYTRHILVTNGFKEELKDINIALEGLSENRDWMEKLKKYDLD